MNVLSYPVGALIMLTPLGREKRGLRSPIIIGIVYQISESFDFKLDTVHAMMSNGVRYCFFEDEIKILQPL